MIKQYSFPLGLIRKQQLFKMVETSAIPYLVIFSHYIRNDYKRIMIDNFWESLNYIKNPKLSLNKEAVIIKLEDVFLHSPGLAPYNLTMYTGPIRNLYYHRAYLGIGTINLYMEILYQYLISREIIVIFVTDNNISTMTNQLYMLNIDKYKIFKDTPHTYSKMKKKYNIICSLNNHITNVEDVLYPKLYKK